ncbi:VOC family protein [Cucumibacter marinus]|uniref:VOC family protein n=1 Tax=Cucumibacter marinus TaxID=1121252 RepID=UPI0004123433|nr:VOC family protein [Cucumibacter marinus]
MTPFHLAFAIDEIEATRDFYHRVLGCALGREAPNWIDFDFFGHQISGHVNTDARSPATTEVAGEQVPLHHFGVVLPWAQWNELIARLRAENWAFLLEPHIRFENEPGEQGTFFIKDPSGNALEFKSFKNGLGLFDR